MKSFDDILLTVIGCLAVAFGLAFLALSAFILHFMSTLQ